MGALVNGLYIWNEVNSTYLIDTLRAYAPNANGPDADRKWEGCEKTISVIMSLPKWQMVSGIELKSDNAVR